MAKATKKVEERFKNELKKYQNILKTATARDINESDTVIIVSDIFSDVLGYDKYAEITTEYAIRGTYCDLAVKIDNTVHFLIEVKAIGISLKDMHIRQAIGYAANEGIDWVILTNGVIWQIYKLTFQKPIEHELVLELDLLNLNPRDQRTVEMLFLLSKEGISKSAIDDFRQRQKAVNRFSIAALLRNDVVLNVVRRELRKLYKGIKVDKEEIEEIIINEVIKRDIIEDERMTKEHKKIQKIATKKQNKTSCNEKPQQTTEPGLQTPVMSPDSNQNPSVTDPVNEPRKIIVNDNDSDM